MTRRRPWTADDDATLRRLWPQVTRRGDRAFVASIAESLDRSVGAVVERARGLGLCRRKEPPWSRVDEERLVDLIDRHATYAEIAATLGRSLGAVRERASLLKSSATRGGLTLTKVAARLAVDQHAVAWWGREGWLRVHGLGLVQGKGEVRVVEYDDLLAFLGDERYWHLVDPARIVDSVLREWAVEVRHGLTFLTTAEAGERLCLTHYAVNQLIRQGRLRAVKRGPNWLVRSDWCVRPEERRAGAKKPWTDAERGVVRRWWGVRPATWIGRILDRDSGSVCAQAYRLGLARVGRGTWKRRRAA